MEDANKTIEYVHDTLTSYKVRWTKDNLNTTDLVKLKGYLDECESFLRMVREQNLN